MSRLDLVAWILVISFENENDGPYQVSVEHIAGFGIPRSGPESKQTSPKFARFTICNFRSNPLPQFPSFYGAWSVPDPTRLDKISSSKQGHPPKATRR